MIIERTRLYQDINGDELSPNESYLFQYALIYSVKDMSSLFRLYDALKQKYPNSLPLFLFESIGQCEYTSMHTTLNNFYRDAEDDNEILQFKFTLDKLNENNLTIDKIETDLMYNDNFSILKKVNKEPAPFIREVKVKLCPTNNTIETFASTPNGYFSGDLQPYENYALIKHLSNNYGYEFLGIGSVFLLFRQRTQLSIEKLRSLINDLAKIYRLDEELIESTLLEHLTLSNYLLLPYADDFEDFTVNSY